MIGRSPSASARETGAGGVFRDKNFSGLIIRLCVAFLQTESHFYFERRQREKLSDFRTEQDKLSFPVIRI